MHFVIHCTVHAAYSVVQGTACCQPMMYGAVWRILDSSLEVQLLESQPRKLEHNHKFVPAAVLTLRSTHKFLAAVSWLNFPCAM